MTCRYVLLVLLATLFVGNHPAMAKGASYQQPTGVRYDSLPKIPDNREDFGKIKWYKLDSRELDSPSCKVRGSAARRNEVLRRRNHAMCKAFFTHDHVGGFGAHCIETDCPKMIREAGCWSYLGEDRFECEQATLDCQYKGKCRSGHDRELARVEMLCQHDVVRSETRGGVTQLDPVYLKIDQVCHASAQNTASQQPTTASREEKQTRTSTKPPEKR